MSTILGLIKISLEIFQSERKNHYLKNYIKIKGEYQDELNKGLSNRSDLRIDKLLFEAETLADLIVAEHSANSFVDSPK